VSDHGPDRSLDTTGFDGGEGIVIEHRTLYFATKGDRRVWEVSLETGEIGVLHDAVARPDTALSHVDNLALHPQTHHLFVAEDGGNMELCVIVVGDGAPSIHPVVQFAGHDGSEVTGPAFSPDGRRLYVTSQRGTDGRGMTVCVTGPWVEYLRSIDGPATAGRPAVRLRS
jgi:secreted PhoX family phosphatase